VLARAGLEVALLERENSYPDRVRGEFMAPWGVTELAKLELLQPLREAGAVFNSGITSARQLHTRRRES
jgi:2-polyprenyl-6-methoxyphenol hydroxylase-like FAD-dependent oxidoreductase